MPTSMAVRYICFRFMIVHTVKNSYVDLRSCHLTNSYQICPGDPRGVSGRVLGAATPLHVAEMRRAVC